MISLWMKFWHPERKWVCNHHGPPVPETWLYKPELPLGSAIAGFVRMRTNWTNWSAKRPQNGVRGRREVWGSSQWLSQLPQTSLLPGRAWAASPDSLRPLSPGCQQPGDSEVVLISIICRIPYGIHYWPRNLRLRQNKIFLSVVKLNFYFN